MMSKWVQIRLFSRSIRLGNKLVSQSHSEDEFDLNRAVAKCKQLPVQINTNLLDVETLKRVDRTSFEFLADLVKGLQEYGLEGKNLCTTLKTHEDWTQLNRNRMRDLCELFRTLSIKPSIYMPIIAQNPQILSPNERQLVARLNELRFFFTNTHLERLLPRSPHILTTSSLDAFRYKFNYVFTLMGIEQREMSSTRLFDCDMQFVRERHLFLERAALYERPNKKNSANRINPKLAYILEPNLKEYLRICARGLFQVDDYTIFCDYLSHENFDNELLASRIDKTLKNDILHDIRVEKRKNRDF